MLNSHTFMLVRADKPRYFWWEVLALFQRTVLTGWLLLIDMPFLQLLSALFVTLAYLVLLLSCRPYRRVFDNAMAVGTQVRLQRE